MAWPARLINLLRRHNLDAEIDAELQFHVEQRTRDNVAAGMSIDEARRDADLMVARGLHSALLVTDAFHSRRAELLFKAAFAHKGLTVRPVSVPDSLDLAHWWSHPVAARRVVGEWAKFAYYLVQGAYW